MIAKETMSSRERVKRAIERKPVDRTPIDFGCHFSTGISAFAYYNLREHLGLSVDAVEMIDCTQLLARVDNDILDRFHIDTVLLNPPFHKTRIWNPRGKFSFTVPDGFTPELMPDGSWEMKSKNGIGYMPAGGFFFDGAWPDFYNMSADERLCTYQKRAELLYKETDRFTMLMGFYGFFGGLDFACDMLTDPDECIAANEKHLHGQIERFDAYNKAMGPYIGAIELNSDLGMQQGPMCSPDSYNEVCYPFLKRFCEHVHNTSDIKLFMHSCGAIAELLPYICDAGVDAINPVQISASGMDPKKLKAAFGEKICFWGGGCDTQVTLWQKSADEVTRHVAELMGIFAPGSGFVFNQVHNIMGNVPPENIVAMFDTAYAHSFECQ